ncbi:AMP-binding protein, partial [Methylogaea oryzae]|uniref:AMP-binding protein n=1 Tax=Methylogaea oryzae TaxID=1295382 RepID=UPI0012E21DAE
PWGSAGETLVAICAERSPELVIGLLGVLKAGGAYLPLDPAYPPARLEFMLKDSGVRLLLSQSHLLEQLPRHDAVETLCLDGLEEGGNADNPSNRAGPDDLAT